MHFLIPSANPIPFPGAGLWPRAGFLNSQWVDVHMPKINFNQAQARFLFGDEADANAYWSEREWRKFAVDVVAGSPRKPKFKRTVYVRAKSPATAISCAKRAMLTKPPRGAVYHARLAGPYELGCVPIAATGDSA